MLEVQQVRKTFNEGTPNEVRSLQGVDLKLDDGSFVIIIGTNGSGKSTLLNAVAGTFYVDSGSIRLGGARCHALAGTQESEHDRKGVSEPFQRHRP